MNENIYIVANQRNHKEIIRYVKKGSIKSILHPISNLRRDFEFKKMCQGLFYTSSQTSRDVASTFYGLSAIVAALGNTFCLIVLWQPSLRSKSYKILSSLALR